MTSPIERQAALTIGTVESLSPSEITVLLETNAPQAVALNTGVPTTFPRINGYVLVPNVDGYIVGIISWLGVERASFPRRKGLKDFGLIDLPYPLRKMNISPIGTLRRESGDRDYRLERGIEVFPSVGDPVTLPTKEQLTCIVETQGADARVQIGTAPLAGDARVIVDPDKIFGRHLAVLGNTGSGKSCSVAGLIRWSLEAAKEKRKETRKGRLAPNARFIILDPNGEYKDAFHDWRNLGKVRVFQVEPKDKKNLPLTVPAWMWNSEEWTSFARAAPGTQRPLLIESLRAMRTGSAITGQTTRRLLSFLKANQIEMRMWYNYPPAAMRRGDTFECGQTLTNIETDLPLYIESEELLKEVEEINSDVSYKDIEAKLKNLESKVCNILDQKRRVTESGTFYDKFSEEDFNALVTAFEKVIILLPEPTSATLETADSPKVFDVTNLPDYLEQIASRRARSGVGQFISTLTMRIEMMLADTRLRPIVAPPKENQLTLLSWLDKYVGTQLARDGQIAIIDLSLVPRYVIHIVISVISRLIFEALQRYQKSHLKKKVLPTVLVLEEAHTFVHRGGRDEENIPTPERMCRETFERIAREGRKFGLGLVLSSQRPSEISPTVLAQCNTFLLHRIVNDRDQELVGRLVPDALGGLLKELPTLPTQRAILLGWATPVPVLVRIRDLPEGQRPKSEDPDFWDVWIGKKPRKIDWKKIAEEWQSA